MKIYDENQFTKSKLDETKREYSLGLEDENKYNPHIALKAFKKVVSYALIRLEKSDKDKFIINSIPFPLLGLKKPVLWVYPVYMNDEVDGDVAYIKFYAAADMDNGDPDDIAKLYKLFPDKYIKEIKKLFYYNYVTKRGNLKNTSDACSINIDTEGSRHSVGFDSFSDTLDSIEIRITIKLKL